MFKDRLGSIRSEIYRWLGWFTLKLSDKSSYVDYNWLDQQVVDGFGKLTNYFGKSLKLTQNGVVQNYLLGGMLGVILLIIIFQQF